MRDSGRQASALRRITLLTDFGTADGYAAAMRGVIAGIAPHVIVDDASHEIPPGDVHAAAFALARYAPHYPPGTVHVVVVDPGVGTARRPLAARIGARHYVAPDNGVLTRVLTGAPDVHIVELTERAYLRAGRSATFHGRDVFAPAAAHLAEGTAIDELGPPVNDPVLLTLPVPRRSPSGVQGEVVCVDRFGNLITNIPRDWLPARPAVQLGDRSIGGVRDVYAAVSPGEAVALVGSDDYLEIGVRDGHAARLLGAAHGTSVIVASDDG
jgi:S-adenosylmethionine hydrolase